MIVKEIYKFYRNPVNIELVPFDDDYCRYYRRGRSKWRPKLKGGVAICILVDENNKEFRGVAKCSNEDNFVYKIGRNLAKDRALLKYNKGRKHD